MQQLEKHNEKLITSGEQGDENLVIYYKKETSTFVSEIEKIFEQLNNHEQVQNLYLEFQKILKKLHLNFKKYEK
ncbi:hypothetical protein N9J72_01080 [Candidatus Gracilibacteria bacterium]|nr:hypothetical protein [Candidatus Gracilibacteria bacterium]